MAAARVAANEERRERSRNATIVIGYDLPPARLSSLLTHGELAYETSRITDTVIRALPAGVPRPEIRFHQRQTEEGYFVNSITTYVEFPDGTDMRAVAGSKWESVKFIPDFCSGPRPMLAYMPQSLTDRMSLARCCFRPKGRCEAEMGMGVCASKNAALNSFQRRSTESQKRERAAELCRDEAFQRRKAAMAHYYCSKYMEGKVSSLACVNRALANHVD